jgi:hypothetical protein
MLSGLTHRFGRNFEVTLGQLCVWKGECANNCIIAKPDAVEVAHLLNHSPLVGEFVEHPFPKALRNCYHPTASCNGLARAFQRFD